MSDLITLERFAGLEVRKVQERDPFLNILVYAESGVGKTTLAGSASVTEGMNPVLFIDIEGGTESLRRSYPDVDIVRVTTWLEMQAVYDELHRGDHPYRTVVLDSLTEIQKFSMYQIMMDLTKNKPEADPDVPGMREWGKNIEQIRKFVRAFRDLPISTIFTALVRDERNNKTGVTSYKPYLSGKLSSEVAAFLDVVGYYYIKEDAGTQRRLLLFTATETYVAKDRSGRLPMLMEDPTMDKIWESMFGPETTETPTTEDALTQLTKD